MVQAVGNHNGYGMDAEYMRLMRELHSFGLSPSGNKNIDSQRLNQAKTELVQRLQKNTENSDSQQGLGVQVINQVDGSEYIQRSEMEEQRLGAMNVAQLNKIYFGL